MHRPNDLETMGELAAKLSNASQPFSIRPEHIYLVESRLVDSSTTLGIAEVEVSGLLHEVQYQGSTTRFELQLENGQTLSVSQANNQWLDSSQAFQPGQRLTARWPRDAMVALHEGI